MSPQQASWPVPEQTHWHSLHQVANEARTAVQSAYSMMAKIDADASLSREGKAQHRHTIAKQAIADFEASQTLARARQAVQLALAKHNVSPEIAKARDAALKAMKEAEQGWRKAIDKIAERASLARPWTHKPAAIGGWLA